MKKIYTIALALFCLSLTEAIATTHNINIVGTTYSPSTLNAVVGDEVIISASQTHPLVQVSQTTWNANQNTPLGGGFGTQTSTFTFTLTQAGDIYFVCQNHVGMGMKGMISVSLSTGIIDLPMTDLQVFPNPVVDGTFNVSGDKELLDGSRLELYSSNGQLAGTFDLTDANATVYALVANGVYTAVIVRNEKAILRQRLLFLNKD